ncbi:uncharacterized protein [Rutidosis leptorrhynchoides]|uniref:uncharacterized protein n=1 Tax=Rutidosis leptorrhynchoides TaxID=125765 RepID=UPI003A9A556F
MPGIANNGPYVPITTIEVRPATKDSPVTEAREVDLPPSRWEDEDKLRVGLEPKIKTMIAITLPNHMFKLIKRKTSSKAILDYLDVTYGGKDEVRQNKIISLKRECELFFGYKNETLKKTFVRFNSLVANLDNLKVKYTDFEQVNRFTDSLPTKLKPVTNPLRTTQTLKNYDMSSIYGTRWNHEKA